RRFDTPQHATTGHHYSWTPAVEVGPDNNFLVTYYDWNLDTDPSALKYRLYSSTLDSNSNLLSGSMTQIFDTQSSDPSLYLAIGRQMRLGEYQGLFFWNGFFHAATVYVKNGVGDIYHVR